MKSKHSTSCRIYTAGEWELYVFFNDKGTKSEGAFGVLLKNGSIYPPASENEVIETEFGPMKYYPLDSQQLWDPKGWLFAEKSEIPRSDAP